MTLATYCAPTPETPQERPSSNVSVTGFQPDLMLNPLSSTQNFKSQDQTSTNPNSGKDRILQDTERDKERQRLHDILHIIFNTGASFGLTFDSKDFVEIE